MAASSLLLLIDDIASILDDVAAMSKIAAKKTAGVLGDDLALNAEKVSGVAADRELSVVWAVAKGSMVNKLILIPLALLISAFIPWAITPLLIVGGLFLCFEGFEKIAHTFGSKAHANAPVKPETELPQLATAVNAKSLEKDKIKGAIRTDFVLSAEIIVITLGTVAAAPLSKQIVVLSVIGVLMTVGVYGLVAGIVKIDDLGLRWQKQSAKTMQMLGRLLLSFAPKLMKTLSIVGTLAMFTVGGGILAHGVHAITAKFAEWSANSGALSWIANTTLEALLGVMAGAAVVALLSVYRLIVPAKSAA
jgi:uncharacterized protein